VHGLSIDTDLNFLIGRTLEEVGGDDYQLSLVFNDDVRIATECDCDVNGAQLPLSEVAPALSPFVGHAIRTWEHAGHGGVRLFFDDGGVLTLLDANEDAESYNITWPGGTIVV
jgi:hypothetical protein